MPTDGTDDAAGTDRVAEYEQALDEIEAAVRRARGEQMTCTPWEFKLPTAGQLAQMRDECGLTRAEFADLVGYEPGTVANYETGQPPGREYIRRALIVFKREWPR